MFAGRSRVKKTTCKQALSYRFIHVALTLTACSERIVGGSGLWGVGQNFIFIPLPSYKFPIARNAPLCPEKQTGIQLCV